LASEKKLPDAFAAALKRELQRASHAEAHDCPAPEVLAGYYDRSLSRSERAGLESHLVSCARCQSMMAAIARADDAGPSSARAETAPGGFFRFALRAAPIALVGAVLAFVVGTRTRNQRAQHEREMIALASPAAETKPEFVERAPVLPPAGLPAPAAPAPEALAQQAGKAALAPEARTHSAHHHKKAESSEGAPLAPEPNVPQRLAKAEPPPPPTAESPTSTSRLESFSVTRSFNVASSAPGAPPQAETPSRQASSAERAEAPIAAAPALAGAGTGAAISGNTVAMASAPQMSQVASPDGRVVWRFGASGVILRAENSTAWTSQPSGVISDLLAASAPSDDICWIVGKSAIVLRTLDGGAHWQMVKGPSGDDFSAVTATDSNNATVTASNGNRYLTHDGGVTWSSP
jgi:hypothetical protein